MFTFENYKFDDLGYVRLPKVHFSLEERRKLGLDESATNSQILKALTNNGLKEKIKNKQIPEKDIAEYVSRCKFELETFDELYFTDYILLVHKIVQKAVVDLGEFYDWGRGSVCGSLTPYYKFKRKFHNGYKWEFLPRCEVCGKISRKKICSPECEKNWVPF
jgi:DNA polymerase III alpha subunit